MTNYGTDIATHLSGLSRGQIDQLVSRYGIPIYCRESRGGYRLFSKTDLFNVMIAGQLHRLGLTMPAIRDVLQSAFGLYSWDNKRDAPDEIYPGQHRAGSARPLLLLTQWNGEWFTRSVAFAERAEFDRGAEVGIIIDAASMVERINTAAAEGDL